MTYNPITWIFTDYGNSRIQQALADSTIELKITQIKVGDANGEYYVPLSSQTSLINEVATFFINEKTQDYDKNLVSFKTVIDENSSGYDIIEVGLYEETPSGLALFALSTQYPIPKPPLSDGYILAINYTANLISSNLSQVYDQIILDEESTYLSEESLTDLANSTLYSTGNLSEQVMNNADIIGLDLPQELATSINSSSKLSSGMAISSLFNSFLNSFGYDSVDTFWVFGRSTESAALNSIQSLTRSDNLTLNKIVTLLDYGNNGLSPYINISDKNNFSIGSDSYFTLGDSLGKSLAFFFIINPNSDSEGTIIAKEILGTSDVEFSLKRRSDGGVSFTLYSDMSNKVTATSIGTNLLPSGKYTPLIITYNGDSEFPLFKAYGSGNKVFDFVSTVEGNFTGVSKKNIKTTSYSINSTGDDSSYINSKVSLLGLLKKDAVDLSNVTYNSGEGISIDSIGNVTSRGSGLLSCKVNSQFYDNTLVKCAFITDTTGNIGPVFNVRDSQGSTLVEISVSNNQVTCRGLSNLGNVVYNSPFTFNPESKYYISLYRDNYSLRVGVSLNDIDYTTVISEDYSIDYSEVYSVNSGFNVDQMTGKFCLHNLFVYTDGRLRYTPSTLNNTNLTSPVTYIMESMIGNNVCQIF